jgi:hypothetical protein
MLSSCARAERSEPLFEKAIVFVFYILLENKSLLFFLSNNVLLGNGHVSTAATERSGTMRYMIHLHLIHHHRLLGQGKAEVQCSK